MTPESAVNFLVLVLIVASLVGLVSRYLRVPYTVSLVVGGLVLGAIHGHAFASAPVQTPQWLSREIVLVIFLPALLFEGSARIPFKELRENLAAVLLLATVGVLATVLIVGSVVHAALGISLVVAMLFGAIIAPTDPVSVLAIFRSLRISRRLSTLVELESLLNDGTGYALYSILLVAVATGRLSIGRGAWEFLFEVAGSALLGAALGFAMSWLTSLIDDPEIEISLSVILAYGSFLLADRLHLSGVLATVAAGLVVGNVGLQRAMSAQTRISLLAFWEYLAFVINSLLFFLIGLSVNVQTLAQNWRSVLIAAGAVLLGRAVAVYGLSPVSGLLSKKIPLSWQHVLTWGGLHGSLSLAMALGLPASLRERGTILTLSFGVVALSILGQGLTIKPLLVALRLSEPAPGRAGETTEEHCSHPEQARRPERKS